MNPDGSVLQHWYTFLMRRTTSYSLSREHDSFLRQQVESGAFKSASDVIRAALQQMAEEQRKETALLEALDEGLESGRARVGVWQRVDAAVKKRSR